MRPNSCCFLLAFFCAQTLAAAAPCHVDAAVGRSTRRLIADALVKSGNHSRKATEQIEFLAVCGDWALVDSVTCDPECPEGGYSLLRRRHNRWTVLPLPDIADCDAATESPFVSRDNQCLAATLKRYPAAPRALFATVNREKSP